MCTKLTVATGFYNLLENSFMIAQAVMVFISLLFNQPSHSQLILADTFSFFAGDYRCYESSMGRNCSYEVINHEKSRSTDTITSIFTPFVFSMLHFLEGHFLSFIDFFLLFDLLPSHHFVRPQSFQTYCIYYFLLHLLDPFLTSYNFVFISFKSINH